MSWTTLAKVKTELGIASGDTSQDARLGQWLSQAHFLLVKEITQEIGNLIESATVASPTVITSRGHGYVTGATINISGCDATPSLNGQHTVTVIDEDTFSVAVNVTGVATRGWINRSYLNQYYSGDGTKWLALRQRPVLSVESVYYDPNGYFGTPPSPATPFDSSTLLVAGTDYLLYIDDDRYNFSERGHIARINSYWTRPNERVRGVLISMPGDSLGNLKVSFTAGYPVCPLDLQYAENQLVTIMKRLSGRGLPVSAESLDYYSYTLAGQVDAEKMIGGIYRTLANYKSWRMLPC